MRAAVLLLLFTTVAVPMGAQTTNVTIPPPRLKTVSLSGPRFGVTALSDGVVDEVARNDRIEVGSNITQFGWQFEKEFYSKGRRRRCAARIRLSRRRAGAGRGAAEPELAGRTANSQRRRVRHRSEHHSGRRRADAWLPA